MRKRASQSLWSSAGSVSTDSSGTFAFLDAPSASEDYRVSFQPGTGTVCGSATSAAARAGVRAGIVFNAVSNVSPHVGQTTRFGGKVLPAHPGKKVGFQVLTSKGWYTLVTSALDSGSAYAFGYRRGSKGSLLFRVIFATQDSDHLWNVSRNIKITWS